MRLYEAYGAEAKGRELLSKKAFKLANQRAALPTPDRTNLAHAVLTNGTAVRGDQLTALGQAKLAYVQTALRLCLTHKTVAFASILPSNLVRPDHDSSTS